MEIKLDVGFCFYETDLATVKRAIESIKEHVRYIFAIDGKYEFFESDDELSSPDVRMYLSCISNVILVDAPNLKEPEKRNKYIDLAKKYNSDWMLMLDADEYITDETDWERVYEYLPQISGSEPAIWGATLRSSNGKELSYPRMWRNPHKIRYMKTHNFFEFQTDHRVFKSSVTWPKIPGIFIKGNDKMRSKEYVDKSYQYQKKLMAYEKPYKEQYRKIAENTKNYTNDPRLPPGIPLM